MKPDKAHQVSGRQEDFPGFGALQKIMELFASGASDAEEKVIREMPTVKNYGIRNRNCTLAKSRLNAELKAAAEAELPEVYREKYDALLAYQGKLDEYDALGKEIKAAQKVLDDLVLAKYESLTDAEIKHLLFDCKWMPRLYCDINGKIDRILNEYASRIIMIAKRYEHTLDDIEDKTVKSKTAVKQAQERMWGPMVTYPSDWSIVPAEKM